jgi:hypothetical protein
MYASYLNRFQESLSELKKMFSVRLPETSAISAAFFLLGPRSNFLSISQYDLVYVRWLLYQIAELIIIRLPLQRFFVSCRCCLTLVPLGERRSSSWTLHTQFQIPLGLERT